MRYRPLRKEVTRMWKRERCINKTLQSNVKCYERGILHRAPKRTRVKTTWIYGSGLVFQWVRVGYIFKDEERCVTGTAMANDIRDRRRAETEKEHGT